MLINVLQVCQGQVRSWTLFSTEQILFDSKCDIRVIHCAVMQTCPQWRFGRLNLWNLSCWLKTLHNIHFTNNTCEMPIIDFTKLMELRGLGSWEMSNVPLMLLDNLEYYYYCVHHFQPRWGYQVNLKSFLNSWHSFFSS